VCRRIGDGERETLREMLQCPRAYVRWAQYLVVRPTQSGDRVRTLHVSWLSALHTANKPVRQP
jgi:hypothetical protein